MKPASLFVVVLVLLCLRLGNAFMCTSSSVLRVKPCVTPTLSRSDCAHRVKATRYKYDSFGTSLRLKIESGPTGSDVIVSSGVEKPRVKPQELLATYGIAYLTTSISFAIVSYALCYFLVLRGVDVAALLGRLGIHPTPAAASAGTAAIAYAMHKAASPIRFPPTVLLTPVVAGWMGGEKLRCSNTGSAS